MATPVEEIKSRVDIVDFINEYTPLKAAGMNWKARCPFHNEKTPSFMVSRDRGSWHCFGCGRGGDVFTFIQEMEGLDFPEALRVLAKKAGVELRSFDRQEQSQKTKIIDALRWASNYWHEVLLKAHEAEAARKYLQSRGLTNDTIETWHIGYAPAGWEMTFAALRKKGLAEDDIFQAGLTIRKERGAGFYDRFRNRIMFPIGDVHGTIVGFSGRILESGEKSDQPVAAKYINSPQTIVYNKGAILFGLDQAKGDIKKLNEAILVEGQMDCIMSHQVGVTNVIASSGTALTLDQTKLLKRYTTNLVLAFDQDSAGAQAALRGVDQALQAEINVRIVRLPGKDPDEVIRRDPAVWSEAIKSGQPILEYYFTQATEGKDMTKVGEKKAAAKFLLPIIAKVGDQIEQTHYLQKLADVLHVTEEVLRRSLPAEKVLVQKNAAETPAVNRAPIVPDRYRAVSERVLAGLLMAPRLLPKISQQLAPEALKGADLQALYKNFIIWHTEDHSLNANGLAQHLASVDREQQDLFALLGLLADKEFSATSDTALEHEVDTMALTLRRESLQQDIRHIEQDIRRLERQGAGSGTELQPLLQRFQEVTQALRSLPDSI